MLRGNDRFTQQTRFRQVTKIWAPARAPSKVSSDCGKASCMEPLQRRCYEMLWGYVHDCSYEANGFLSAWLTFSASGTRPDPVHRSARGAGNGPGRGASAEERESSFGSEIFRRRSPAKALRSSRREVGGQTAREAAKVDWTASHWGRYSGEAWASDARKVMRFNLSSTLFAAWKCKAVSTYPLFLYVIVHLCHSFLYFTIIVPI